ncbi:MAG TPA: DUF1134 domain-containing protein [Acidiferrobacteraceae bacterium]|nr:DUF1134 domain-containing protein [Acidiferrobacteraceae bacterium]
MCKIISVGVMIGWLCLLPLAAMSDEKTNEADTYDQETVLKEAEAFFGKGAQGLAKIIEKAFKDHGRPDGYIRGEEAGGAVVVGVRYGDGTLVLKRGVRRKVHWKGPSVGFEIGGSAAKVFMLVYNLPKLSGLFHRYPGVEGSLYFIGGLGISYVKRDDTVLAPIRLGVGWRYGANVGYLHFTRKKSWVPF